MNITDYSLNFKFIYGVCTCKLSKVTMEAIIDNLKSVFTDEYAISVGKNPDRIFQKCAELCKRHSLEADDLALNWLSFAASNGINDMEENKLDAFEKQELLNRKDANEEQSLSISELNTRTTTVNKIEIFGKVSNADSDNEMDNDEPDDILQAYGLTTTSTDTPKSARKPKPSLRSKLSDTPKGTFSPAGFSPAVQSKSVSYGARTKAGETVLRYKCKDSEYWNEISGENKQSLKITPVTSSNALLDNQSGFKYMFQKTVDLATTLNAVIADLGYEMLSEDEKEIQDLRVSSMAEGWYHGRIRNDEGRLTQSSTFLEGDLDFSGGHAVSLDLSSAEEYRLFPGQVVLLRGQNDLGKCLRVSEVVVPSVLPLPEILPESTCPINVIVASGPFTPIDSLQYEPLWDFMEMLKKETPDLCILAGPFVDPFHPMITDGELANTFDELFESIIEKIWNSIGDIKTRVVIVSSSKDAFHYAVFPTPSYHILEKYKDKITVLPDPAIFEVAGITIGLTTMDILKHLANSEIAKSTIADRMGGLSKLILSQRNFYPLYPPDESVPLDVQLWSRHCKFAKTPHILLLPSDLRYFIKEVEGTIVLNPERLTKGKSGGTFAKFQVKFPDSTETKVESIADFCSGEIIKI